MSSIELQKFVRDLSLALALALPLPLPLPLPHPLPLPLPLSLSLSGFPNRSVWCDCWGQDKWLIWMEKGIFINQVILSKVN